MLATQAPSQGVAPTGAARPLEAALERPFALRLWRSNRAFLEILLSDLDAGRGAIAAEPGRDLFDLDVYVMFLADFDAPEDAEGHVLEQVLRRELARLGPASNFALFRVPLTRNSDGAQKALNVIAVETGTMREISDLCLAVILYDMARWYFSSPPALALDKVGGRSNLCQREGWRSVEEARAAEVE
ncbi:hypothetical protein [Pseudaestuariivita atlantica]|nr:hypothetical protein [Pseudaestuariivita atlantica]